MDENSRNELYQQMILEHHHHPRNCRAMETPTHQAEGYNPLCGDHLKIFLKLDAAGTIADVSFEGDGCAISRAAASMMTAAVKGKTVEEAHQIFEEFHRMLLRQLNPEQQDNHLGKLKTFSGIWQYPSRVKCASLCWHTLESALKGGGGTVSTEDSHAG